MASSSRQLPLNVRLRDEATFDNFWVAPGAPQALALSALKGLARGEAGVDRFLYLWGPVGAGISHLLQAACHEAHQAGRISQYLPLAEVVSMPPAELLEGFDQGDVLCLDNLEAVAGRPAWDESLFHLYNRLRERGAALVVAAPCAPRDLPQNFPDLLPDLQSRLAWGTVFHIEALDDGAKRQALQWRAQRRGLDMSDEVAAYLLSRGSRAPRDLFDCLDRLDRQSLVEKRKLTLPFVKAALEG